jgi:hypothetical protein
MTLEEAEQEFTSLAESSILLPHNVLQPGSDYIEELMSNGIGSTNQSDPPTYSELESEWLADVPTRYWERIERATFTAYSIIPACRKWKLIKSIDGLTVRTAESTKHHLSAFGEICLDYSAADIFAVIIDPKYVQLLHSRVRVHEITACLSIHCWFEYIAMSFNQAAIISPRDYSNLVHWRRLDNGIIIIVYVSEVPEEFPETIEGFIRCKFVLGGVIITPLVVSTQAEATADIPSASVTEEFGRKSSLGNCFSTRVSYFIQSNLQADVATLIMDDIAVDAMSVLLRLKGILSRHKHGSDEMTMSSTRGL